MDDALGDCHRGFLDRLGQGWMRVTGAGDVFGGHTGLKDVDFSEEHMKMQLSDWLR